MEDDYSMKRDSNYDNRNYFGSGVRKVSRPLLVRDLKSPGQIKEEIHSHESLEDSLSE